MTSFDIDPALLPASGEAPRCAEHADAIDLDPVGSALHVDEVLLIDVPQPWPKPVWAADGFTHVPEAVMAAGSRAVGFGRWRPCRSTMASRASSLISASRAAAR